MSLPNLRLYLDEVIENFKEIKIQSNSNYSIELLLFLNISKYSIVIIF